MVTTSDSMFVFTNVRNFLPSMNDNLKRFLEFDAIIPNRRHSSHDVRTAVPSIEVIPPSPGTPNRKMSFFKAEIEKLMTALEVCRSNMRRSSEPCCTSSNLNVPHQKLRRRMSMPSISHQNLLKVPTPSKRKHRRRHSLPTEVTQHTVMTSSQLKRSKSQSTSFERIRQVENSFGEKTTVHEIFIDTQLIDTHVESEDRNSSCSVRVCDGAFSCLVDDRSECNENVSNIPTLNSSLSTPLQPNYFTNAIKDAVTQPPFHIFPMTTTCAQKGEVSCVSSQHSHCSQTVCTDRFITLFPTQHSSKVTNTQQITGKFYQQEDIVNKHCVVRELFSSYSTAYQQGGSVTKADTLRMKTTEISDHSLRGSETMRTISSDEVFSNENHKVVDKITNDGLAVDAHLIQHNINNSNIISNHHTANLHTQNYIQQQQQQQQQQQLQGKMSPTKTLSAVLNIIPDVISEKANTEFLFNLNENTSNHTDLLASKVAYNVKTNDINMSTSSTCGLSPIKATSSSDINSDDDVSDSKTDKTKVRKRESFRSIAEMNEDDSQPVLPKANSLTRLDSFDQTNNHKSPSKHRAFSFHEESIEGAELLKKLTTSYDSQHTSASMEQLDAPSRQSVQRTYVNKFNRNFANAMVRKAVSLYELQNERFKENVAKFEQKFLSTEVLSVQDGEDDSEQFFPRVSIEDCSSCASCRSRSSSYHSLLYDIDTANKYPIYQPTVCDYVHDDDKANEHPNETIEDDYQKEESEKIETTKLANDAMKTKKEKLMRQGHNALGSFKEKWRRVKSKV